MMDKASPLPKRLMVKYRAWRETGYLESAATFRALAEVGQDPRDMMISCCDSRVQVSSVFGATVGDIFIHRNVAALVPPYETTGGRHGTSAAIEYGVNSLKVTNLTVIGHSQCGGVEGCYRMCTGAAPELLEETSFVGRWMEVLRPGFDRLPGELSEAERLSWLEKEAVVVSLENLMTFPFVAEAVEAGRLSIHGLWMNIGEGRVEEYRPSEGGFVPL